MCFGKKKELDSSAVNTRSVPSGSSPRVRPDTVTKAPKITVSDNDIIKEAASLQTYIEQHIASFYASADEAVEHTQQFNVATAVLQLANYPLGIHQGKFPLI